MAKIHRRFLLLTLLPMSFALFLPSSSGCAGSPDSPGLAGVSGLTSPTDAGAESSDPANIVTQRYDNARTGATLGETTLNTSNVNVRQFGLLFTRPVDGLIYAQPLYLSNVDVPGRGFRDVVYVATEHDSVYAFDATDPSAATPLWQTNLGPSVPASDVGCGDLNPEIGITSTPVLDPDSGTLFVEAKSKEDNAYWHRLHALDVATGAEKPGSPVVISGSVAGDGVGSENGRIAFDPLWHLNRPALLLSGGQVVLGFASHCDAGPYHGWVFSYDAHSLVQTGIWNATSGGAGGGVWQSGGGLAADERGTVYFQTGNGDSDPIVATALSETFVALRPTATGLALVDWFMPPNYQELNAGDLDLGSSGTMMIPATNLLIGGGKQGIAFVLDRGGLGEASRTATLGIPLLEEGSGATEAANGQSGTVVGDGEIHSGFAYWNGPRGPMVYVWPAEDSLRAFSLEGVALAAASSSSSTTEPPHWPGGTFSLSSHGSTPGSGIVWATSSYVASDNSTSGILRAFDATDLSLELWNSRQNQERDDLGAYAKYNPSAVTHGRVYVGTFSGRLNVYGLLPTNDVHL